MKKYRHIINIGLILILATLSVQLLITILTTSAAMNIQHYNSLVLTTATLILLFLNKNIFTLLLGVTLIIGNCAGLSAFHKITTFSTGPNVGSLHIPIYWGQPAYSIMLFVYLIFNKEFFIGILSKKYWIGFTKRTTDFEREVVVIKLGQQPKEDTENDAQ